MKKQTFLDMLKKRLSGLPKQEIAERLTFYNEMIDDRMEEGMSEEEKEVLLKGMKNLNRFFQRKLEPKEEA